MKLSGLGTSTVRLKVVLATFALFPTLQADTIFASLPASNSSGANSAIAPMPGVAYAAAFLATQSFRVQSVVLPTLLQPSSGSNLNVGIFSNAQGLPGSSLGSTSSSTGSSGAVSFTSLGVKLSAGRTYWLVVSPNSATTAVGLTAGEVQTSLASTTDINGVSGWTAQGQAPIAFAVNGSALTAIPEPRTVLLTLLALGGLAAVRRAKHP